MGFAIFRWATKPMPQASCAPAQAYKRPRERCALSTIDTSFQLSRTQPHWSVHSVIPHAHETAFAELGGEVKVCFLFFEIAGSRSARLSVSHRKYIVKRQSLVTFLLSNHFTSGFFLVGGISPIVCRVFVINWSKKHEKLKVSYNFAGQIQRKVYGLVYFLQLDECFV